MYADPGEPHQGVILKRLKKPAFAGFFNAQNLKNHHGIDRGNFLFLLIICDEIKAIS
jgi:hypothetical protein